MARIYIELYKKDLHDPDNDDDVITHLEPDKGKWALGSKTMNKASGGDGIPAELFQILKYDGISNPKKCYTPYPSKFGKLSSGHRTGKGQFHFNPKEGQCQGMLRLQHNHTHFTC